MMYSRSKQEQFIMKKQIGQGTFGRVERCVRKSDGKILAVKIIFSQEIDIDQVRDEAEVMSKIHSDYTIQVLDHFYDKQLTSYILVIPFYRNGSLQKLMYNTKWTPEDILLFLVQMQKAFTSIYNRGVWHLDLKPDNILIKEPGQYVLCDFGCAKSLDNAKISYNLRISINKGGGTTDYAAPQLVLDYQSSKYSDVWSLGVILYQMIYEKIIPQKATLEQLKLGKLQINYPEKPGYEKVIAICKRMLVDSKDHHKRISWQQLGLALSEAIGINPRTNIITDTNQLVEYAQNINIILSGMIYYIEQAHTYLQVNKIDSSSIVEATKSFMTHHIVMIERTLEGHFDKKYSLYYLFQQTRKNYKEIERQKINNIKARTLNFTNQNEKQASDYKNTEMYFLGQCSEFKTRVLPLTKPSPKLEWYKVQNALKLIVNSGISYENKLAVKQFAHEILYL